MLKKYRSILFFIGMVASVLQAEERRENTLTVQGSALMRLPSSELQLSLSTLSFASNAQEALMLNQKKMERLLAALKQAGLQDQEIETGNFTVTPTYTRPPKDPDENWRAQINGYEIRNTLSIRTDKLALAGKMIDAAVDGGADQIDALNFTIANPEEAQNKALELAIQHAALQAQVAANAAQVKLKRIREIAVGSHDHVVYPQRTGLFKAAAMETQISPGNAEVRGNVTIVYEIEGEAHSYKRE